jgi:hypothetical protein
METHEAVLAEIAGALGILGLLLVFLPLYLQWVGSAGGDLSQSAKDWLTGLTWVIPCLIVLATVDATVGLFAIWGKWGTANATGWLLLVLVWLVAALAVVTVFLRIKT